MRIIAINGSPRKKGNTATMLGWVCDTLKADGHKVSSVNITGRNIEGCVGCYKCKKKYGKLVCKFDDYAMKLFRRMEKCDLIIYASTLYCWGFTSQMKAFLDRHICLVNGYGNPDKWKSHLEGKRVSLLVTAADHEGPGNTDTISMIFERIAGFTKTEIAGSLIVPNCTTPSKLGSARKKMAQEYARKIVS